MRRHGSDPVVAEKDKILPFPQMPTVHLIRQELLH